MRCLRLTYLALCGALISFNAAAEELSTDANIITGLDVSSSINAQETMLQIEGMAAAIRSPAILAAIPRRHGRIGFAGFSGRTATIRVVSWRMSAPTRRRRRAQEITGRCNRHRSSSRSSAADHRSGAIDHALRHVAEAPFASQPRRRQHLGQRRGQCRRRSSAPRDDLLRGVSHHGECPRDQRC